MSPYDRDLYAIQERLSHMKDPFKERAARILRRRISLLGGVFEFQSDSAELLSLVEAAYGRLPPQRLPGKVAEFTLRLTLRSDGERIAGREPAQPRTRAGAGLICATVDAWNFAALHPESRQGLVSISRQMLAFPYHARYELLEFSVFTLATRALGLVPLHAACIGLPDRALLLVGESGAGKSTLTLQCMLRGMQLLAEDAVFIDPRSLLATGVPNFLHLRSNSVRYVDSRAWTTRIRRSGVIRRRSGVRKLEVDLRRGGFRIARGALQITGIVFVSPERARGPGLLSPIDPARAIRRLAGSQEYAAGLAAWKPFSTSLTRVPAFELRRGRHPAESAEALERLLHWGSAR
jgi:hypothetical protein